ncbi:flagellar hook-associated protein FlgK [Aliisedimentitalea scapharcae]|uniref:Flagellar hook-associated protein 1 n=1 Tax=Aliisedimentitalea scapharcae TaxID=1524259 RepID=A0ABZ2XW40_9RHOB
MSITSTFNTALSGLSAARRSALTISDNLANALTPGYARRTTELVSQGDLFPGVRVAGVVRNVDPAVVSSRRGAEAELGGATAQAQFFDRMATLVGDPTSATSIGSRLAAFDGALIEAASLPHSPQRLDQAVAQAHDLASSLSDAAEGLRNMRTQADQSIATQVDKLNTALAEVQKLNVRITAAQSGGNDAAALMDQRDMLIDNINVMVPVKVVARDFGQVALYSDGGAILLDGQAAELKFTATRDTMPHMSVDNGLLSGLEINERPVRTDNLRGAIRGGTLAAQFEIRDELAVSAQDALDAAARDLVERFQDAALDSTVSVGAAGLFTDDGAAFDPANEVGISNRISVNAAVDPTQGGESWRLRAGLGASDPGDPGEARLLQAFGAALDAPRLMGSMLLGPGSMSADAVANSLLSHFASLDGRAEQSLGYASVLLTETQRIEQEQGVDTDAELQNLMLVEKAYAANARMLQTVDELMETLLRL